MKSFGRLAIMFGVVAAAAFARADEEQDFYEISTFNPGGIDLEVSGLTALRDGRVMLATRGGEVFILEGAYGDPKQARLQPYAFGLSTPLGLLERDDGIYVVQRGELTRLQDTDGDGRADRFDTISDQWEIGGNYHEYAFGPREDKNGKLWVTLNKPFGDQPYGDVPWRGWAMRIDPKTGQTDPVAVGLRSPSGIESSPEGEIFYSDNQGEWCNASKISVIEPGDFHGHPYGLNSLSLPRSPIKAPLDKQTLEGVLMKDLPKTVPNFKLPAVWLPYDKTGKSPSGFRWDLSGGKFGPFAGQVFLGDQHHAWIMRVSLEKVGGRWQGAAYRFRQGFQSGIVRLAFGKDGTLFVGMTNAGWGSKGTSPFGLQRLVWKGGVPFEIKEMKVVRGGFDLEFTQPIDPASVKQPGAFTMSSYTYRLSRNYGGPEEDVRDLNVTVAQIAADNRRVRLKVEPLRTGYVHELHAPGVRAQQGGKPLLHPEAYYTLINVP